MTITFEDTRDGSSALLGDVELGEGLELALYRTAEGVWQAAELHLNHHAHTLLGGGHDYRDIPAGSFLTWIQEQAEAAGYGAAGYGAAGYGAAGAAAAAA